MAAAAVKSPGPPFAIRPDPLQPQLDNDEDDEFEFSIPAAAAVLSAADELFSGGKLVPMLPPPRPSPPCSLPPCSLPPCLEVPSEPASPRGPRCSGHRWRDLLLLVSRKPSAGETKDRMGGDLKRRESHAQPLLSRASSSSSSTSSCDSGRNARRPPQPSRSPLQTRSAPVASLLHLMSKKQASDKSGAPATDAPPRRREAQCAYPFLTRVSSSSSASSFDSGRNSRAPWLPPGPPARPRPAVAAESPRVSASGRVVFRGLERCSSSPATAGISPRRPRPRGMERSFSANVRVDPVINLFGFGHLFLPSSPAKEKKADKDSVITGGRRNRPAKLAMVLRDPQD